MINVMTNVNGSSVKIDGNQRTIILEFLHLLAAMPNIYKDCNENEMLLIKKVFRDSIYGHIDPDDKNSLLKYKDLMDKAFLCDECPCEEKKESKKKANDSLSDWEKEIDEVIEKLAKEFDLDETIVKVLCDNEIGAYKLTNGIVTMIGVDDGFASFVKRNAYDELKKALKKELNR